MMSMYALVLALAGFSCVLAADLPEFCQGTECPRFKVLEKTQEYELREYEPSLWVAANIEGIDIDEATSTMFPKLLSYIKGNNAKGVTMGMTVPVLVKITPGPGPACPNNFTMGFFIAPKHAASAPPPNDQMLKLTKLPTEKRYVRSFGGHAEIEQFVMEAAKLMKVIPSGAKVDKSHFYRATFNDPLESGDRHNEVWYTVM